eukprot:CAMPEP_0119301996 /NCGR_PEP_ID=MMETSP1333-20130426/3679_1 /TAXON_ID=418940 /ORGANISM="Scyphosphaera apsteinii, Strain RCC1455" /LENGTH=278 /DNA_ID=CAMNT_0007304221 /DNA_START=504 /DNA_END=1340 /DNA_ORIENTATION=+
MLRNAVHDSILAVFWIGHSSTLFSASTTHATSTTSARFDVAPVTALPKIMSNLVVILVAFLTTSVSVPRAASITTSLAASLSTLLFASVPTPLAASLAVSLSDPLVISLAASLNAPLVTSLAASLSTPLVSSLIASCESAQFSSPIVASLLTTSSPTTGHPAQNLPTAEFIASSGKATNQCISAAVATAHSPVITSALIFAFSSAVRQRRTTASRSRALIAFTNPRASAPTAPTLSIGPSDQFFIHSISPISNAAGVTCARNASYSPSQAASAAPRAS